MSLQSWEFLTLFLPRSNHDCAGDGPDPDTGVDAVGDLRAEQARAEREVRDARERQANAAAQLHHVVRAQRKVVAAKASLVARRAAKGCFAVAAT